jgi:hypothetical protein
MAGGLANLCTPDWTEDGEVMDTIGVSFDVEYHYNIFKI